MRGGIFLLAAFAANVCAHGNGVEGLPQLMGARKFLSTVKSRNLQLSVDNIVHKRGYVVEKRATSDGRCGPGIGSCTNCCSAQGYCGSGPDYCISPDCQYQYGPLCHANIKPAGASTAEVPRPLVGSVPYGGAGIFDCVTPGIVAFTFDDGPYLYTEDLLDKLKRYNAKATFFITGNNLGKGPIDSTPAWSKVIKRMVSEKHQVASHTWTHQSLDKIDSQTFNNQIHYNEMGKSDVKLLADTSNFLKRLEIFLVSLPPNYVNLYPCTNQSRPPYSQCEENGCGAKLKKLGYHIIYFDVDTAGYLNADVSRIQKSKDIWDSTIAAADPATSNFLEIEHDIHYQIVYNLTDHILDSMYSRGYRSVTVGECLGDPQANWYRPGN
ncbi:hypothetical protein Golomagni_03514 [Golovinomyces magnicellulatus]|nr:hypothetical protein Golomagni_03514 [Golovinomyces magnicellulatus]